MRPTAEKRQPERDHTDQRLQVERAHADHVLKEAQALDDAADDRVERTREAADVALEQTRTRADQVTAAETPADHREAVLRERDEADSIHEDERIAADENLRQDREKKAAVMKVSLPLERQETDRSLESERLQADDALVQRDDVLGMVSHDLRELLHGMVMNTTLLLSAARASETGFPSVERLEQIQQSATRMNRLVGDLLDVVSIDAGRLSIQREVGDIATVIAEAIGGFASAASDKQITLDLAPLLSPVKADVDPLRLLQVLTHLVSNAIKFCPEGGVITVLLDCSDDEIHLVVADTGKGIPADELEKIFERFWQVGKPDRRGFGLGLYVSRCIVDAHGGRLWVESVLGKGSRFHVQLPRWSPAAVHPSAKL